jgi:hypothetical protein
VVSRGGVRCALVLHAPRFDSCNEPALTRTTFGWAFGCPTLDFSTQRTDCIEPVRLRPAAKKELDDFWLLRDEFSAGMLVLLWAEDLPTSIESI